MKVGLVGATGLVGREILKLLEKLPVKQLSLFASNNSIGKEISFKGQKIVLKELNLANLKGHDFIFFCAGSSVSKVFAKEAARHSIVIDSSSFFRRDESVPLIIPEINPHSLKNHHNLIASPNCTTTIMLMALFPLHKAFQIKRVVAATYQAASGGGKRLMDRLIDETASFLKNPAELPQYGFNLFLHNSPLNEDLYSEEEQKMVFETAKILEDPSIKIASTCVRVPILRVHSIAINVEFKKKPKLDIARKLLREAKGVKFQEDWYPSPRDAAEREEVLCGRLRKDLTSDKALDLWVVGDQLLKGAALNAVQIMKLILQLEAPK